jgi:hypothetical protein
MVAIIVPVGNRLDIDTEEPPLPPPVADNTPLEIDNPLPTLIPPRVLDDAVGNSTFTAPLTESQETILPYTVSSPVFVLEPNF